MNPETSRARYLAIDHNAGHHTTPRQDCPSCVLDGVNLDGLNELTGRIADRIIARRNAGHACPPDQRNDCDICASRIP